MHFHFLWKCWTDLLSEHLVVPECCTASSSNCQMRNCLKFVLRKKKEKLLYIKSTIEGKSSKCKGRSGNCSVN